LAVTRPLHMTLAAACRRRRFRKTQGGRQGRSWCRNATARTPFCRQAERAEGSPPELLRSRRRRYGRADDPRSIPRCPPDRARTAAFCTSRIPRSRRKPVHRCVLHQQSAAAVPEAYPPLHLAPVESGNLPVRRPDDVFCSNRTLDQPRILLPLMHRAALRPESAPIADPQVQFAALEPQRRSCLPTTGAFRIGGGTRPTGPPYGG